MENSTKKRRHNNGSFREQQEKLQNAGKDYETYKTCENISKNLNYRYAKHNLKIWFYGESFKTHGTKFKS